MGENSPNLVSLVTKPGHGVRPDPESNILVVGVS
jgi:hypothetical protein